MVIIKKYSIYRDFIETKCTSKCELPGSIYKPSPAPPAINVTNVTKNVTVNKTTVVLWKKKTAWKGVGIALLILIPVGGCLFYICKKCIKK